MNEINKNIVRCVILMHTLINNNININKYEII